jgi:fructoselysine-6-P-deglycase FrlB-like protein
MSEPVDYLIEETYCPYWLKEGVTESTLEAIAKKKLELIEIGKKLSEAKRFYMVGSGGSYSVQLPLTYIAEKYTNVPVFAFSGRDFLERQPYAVDEEAVVIHISSSGKTKEILDALDWSNKKGAITMGISQNKESMINAKSNIGYGWGTEGVTFGKLMSLYYLFGSILKEKAYPVGSKMIKEADKLPNLIPAMIPKAKKSARKLGLEFKDYDKIFVIGGGINWGLAYQFALCTLMEMCWIHGISVNYSEFRHGALELFTEGAATIFLRGKSGQRQVEESVLEFSRENVVKSIVYDSQGLDVDNLLTPFTLLIEVEWLSYYLSLAKNRRMGSWRFYDKVKF